MEIEKNIPVPKSDGRGRPTKYPFPDMEIGDSVFVPGGFNGCSAYASAAQHARRNGKKFSGRKEGEGLRIWRVE